MRKHRLITLTSVFCLLLLARTVSAGQPGWISSYSEARSRADQLNMPLLIHFHAWYCGPCQRMNREVFSSSSVQSELQEGLVAVEVDVTQDQELARQYGVSTVPRDVVVFPDGTVETLKTGFVPRSSYLQMLSSIAARGRTVRQQLMSALTSEEPEPESSTPEVPETAESLPIGLEGFCPVRLHESREWIAGSETITESYRGIQYRFSDEEARDRFRSNPRDFAPENLGCDPVVLRDSQKAVAGNIEFGAFFDDKLFLFSSVETRTQFKANPLKFTRITYAVRPADLSGQRFQ